MSKGQIRISEQAVVTAESVLEGSSELLEVAPLDFNLQSNLTAVSNASAAYSNFCSTLKDLQKILTTDARRIEQMGEEFAALDASIAGLYSGASQEKI